MPLGSGVPERVVQRALLLAPCRDNVDTPDKEPTRPPQRISPGPLLFSAYQTWRDEGKRRLALHRANIALVHMLTVYHDELPYARTVCELLLCSSSVR